MASTYSTNLKIELIGTGEQAGIWGNTTNTNLGTALEQAIVGKADIDMDSTTVTLTLTNTNAAQDARAIYLNLTGTPGGAAELEVPAVQKPYIVKNGSDQVVTVKVTGQTGVAVPVGKTVWVYNNGTDVVPAVDHVPSLTLGSALPVASGGTGQTSYTDGQLLIGNTSGNTLTKATLTAGSGVTITNGNGSISIAATGLGGTVTSVDVSGGTTGLTTSGGPITGSGTITIAGTLGVANGGTGATTLTGVLKGNGTSAFTAGSVSLTSEVTGTLPVANGGTGATSLTANNVLLGNGTSAPLEVAPGTAGNALISDGTTWTSAAPQTGVTVGSLQYFAGEPDGNYPPAEWLECNGEIYTQTAYSNLFNVLGYVANTSPITWTTRTSGILNLIAATYGNGLFVVAGVGGNLATSTDAITWEAQTSGTTSTIRALEYGDGIYLYGADGGVLATSTDAITWEARTSGTTSSIQALTYGNGIYLYAGAGGVLATSTDAITWEARTSGTTANILALTYGNGLYVYARTVGGLATSTNAITWTARTSGTTANILALTYGNGVYVYGGNAAVLGTSTDGITWTARTSGVTTGINIQAVGSSNGVLVYAATGGNLRTSTDGGVTWEARTSGSTTSLSDLAYGNGTWVVTENRNVTNNLRVSSDITYNAATEFAVPNSSPLQTDINFYIPARLFVRAE